MLKVVLIKEENVKLQEYRNSNTNGKYIGKYDRLFFLLRSLMYV